MTTWAIEEIRDALARRSAIVVGGSWAEVCDYVDLTEDEHLALPEPEGVLVDIQTANAIVAVHDALSPENRERFAALPLERAGAVAWKLVR